MKVIHEYPVKVFENTYEDKKYYKIGVSKKDQNGNYINGYLDCRFRKDVEVDTSKKIYIQDAWLDFYVKDKVTHNFLFVNKFEYVSDVIKNESAASDPFEDFGNEVALTDEDLPF